VRTVFADTVYWVALLMGNDPWAQMAQGVTQTLGEVHLVTTEEILSEFLAAISRAGRTARKIAAERVLDLLHDESVTVYPQSHGSFLDGLEFYMRRLASISTDRWAGLTSRRCPDRAAPTALCLSPAVTDIQF
jgi:predicted nucleic acid-binding protein